jgi:hypothetical protein
MFFFKNIILSIFYDLGNDGDRWKAPFLLMLMNFNFSGPPIIIWPLDG